MKASHIWHAESKQYFLPFIIDKGYFSILQSYKQVHEPEIGVVRWFNPPKLMSQNTAIIKTVCIQTKVFEIWSYL